MVGRLIFQGSVSVSDPGTCWRQRSGVGKSGVAAFKILPNTTTDPTLGYLPYDSYVRNSFGPVLISVIRESVIGRVGALFAAVCIPFVVNMIVFRFTGHTLKGIAFIAAGFLFLVGALISATLLSIATFRSIPKSN